MRSHTRKFTGLLLLVSLIATACSGGGDTDSSSDGPDGTQDEPGNELSGDDLQTPETTAPANDSATPVSVWVPSSLALKNFVEVAVSDAPSDIGVIEEPATYDATAAAAAVALANGHLALVPSTIGLDLVDDGSAVFVGRIFEDEDPAVAARQLGAWLLTSPDSGIVGARTTNSTQGTVTLVAFRRAETTPSPEAQEVIDFIGAEEQEAMDSFVKSGTIKAGKEIIETAVTSYGAKGGAGVALRGVAKAAGPVASVLDFLKTVHDFTEAKIEVIEAESNAMISLYDSGMAATGIISDATTRMHDLELALVTGEVSPEDALELVSTLQNSIGRTSNIATDSATDLEELGNEVGAAQILQLRRSNFDTFVEQTGEVFDEIDAQSAKSNTDDDADAYDTIFHVRSDGKPVGGLEEAAEFLVQTGSGNESRHSNGELTVTSEGETDLLGVGQMLWAPAAGGASLASMLQCGQHDSTHTVCGGRAYDSDYLAVVALLDGDIDFNSDKLYQFGFVFDRDGNPINNFAAGGDFPFDTWDQSDIRYGLTIDEAGPQLAVTEGPNFSPVDSGAKIHIDGNVILGFLPRDEVGGGPTDPLVPMRVTTFWHFGDFGMGPDEAFNIDLFPVVPEPYWTPDEAIFFEGPPALPNGDATVLIPDQLVAETFDTHRNGFASGFSAFGPGSVTPDDPTPMQGLDQCFANEYFFHNPTVQILEREAFVQDDVSIQVRYEGHDSEAAARGAFGFSAGPVSNGCRSALLSDVGANVEDLNRIVEDEMFVVDRFALGGTADGLSLDVYSGYVDTTYIQVTTTGPPSDEVADIITEAFATIP